MISVKLKIALLLKEETTHNIYHNHKDRREAYGHRHQWWVDGGHGRSLPLPPSTWVHEEAVGGGGGGTAAFAIETASWWGEEWHGGWSPPLWPPIWVQEEAAEGGTGPLVLTPVSLRLLWTLADATRVVVRMNKRQTEIEKRGRMCTSLNDFIVFIKMSDGGGDSRGRRAFIKQISWSRGNVWELWVELDSSVCFLFMGMVFGGAIYLWQEKVQEEKVEWGIKNKLGSLPTQRSPQTRKFMDFSIS